MFPLVICLAFWDQSTIHITFLSALENQEINWVSPLCSCSQKAQVHSRLTHTHDCCVCSQRDFSRLDVHNSFLDFFKRFYLFI